MRIPLDVLADDVALATIFQVEPRVGPLRGGRTAGLQLLGAYDASRYGKTRNFLNGAVSRLSPYLRHGMLTMPEVRDAIRQKYAGAPESVEELLRQLAWRDFFEKVLDWHGTGLEDDLEPAKHGVPRCDDLPSDIAQADTRLPCIDGMLRTLFDTGYLHNHERLWFAAYLCHFRGISWKRGAELFRKYLYDGDVASNNASWQWVESTFASKPYYMNQENIANYSGNQWCETCTAVCPFRASYEVLQRRLFETGRAPLGDPPWAEPLPLEKPLTVERTPPVEPRANGPVMVWMHDAAMSAEDVTVRSFPNAPVVFTFDATLQAKEQWAFHRLRFMADGVREAFERLPNAVKEVRFGDAANELADFAVANGCTEIAYTDSPNPWVRGPAAELERRFTMRAMPRPTLTEYADEPKRFTRFWESTARQVLGYVPKKRSRMR